MRSWIGRVNCAPYASDFVASPSRGEGRTPLAWTVHHCPSSSQEGGPSHMAFGVGVRAVSNLRVRSLGMDHPHLTRHDELVHPMKVWMVQLMTRLPPPSRGRRSSADLHRQLPLRRNLLRRGLLVVAFAVLASAGLSQPATAQSNKNKTPQAAAQPSSAKPKIPPGSDPGGVAVAIIGSGVNYTLPQISSRLARDGEGDIIGLDFIDRDVRPFDVAGPDATPDGIRPIGTTLASVLLADAPKLRLVPVRIGMGEPRQFGGAVAFVASTPARIALVAFSSSNRADWEPFEQAAKAAPNVLFVLPAGDNGQDLDKAPLYPASLQLPNAIVVTAGAIEWVRDPQPVLSANFGIASVDVEASAAGLQASAFDGRPVTVSGSAYAAARVAAWAARTLEADRSLTVEKIKNRVLGLAKPQAGVERKSRSGAIAYPFGGWPIAPRF